MFRKTALILMIGILTIIGTASADVLSNRSVGILYSDRGVITGVLCNSAGFSFGIFTNLDFGPSAELRKTNTSNYGKTKIGECNYDELYGLDIGYSKRLYKYLKLGAEISVGYECETRYSKYSDERFTEGYYLSEEEKDSNYLVGIGGIIIIPFNNRFELISSYNSIKGISGGIMVRF